MPFRDFNEVAQPEFLALPINGKTYVIPPIGALDGIKLELQFADPVEGVEPPPPMTNEELNKLTLGAALEEMRQDNVPALFIARASMTSLADHQNGRVVAEAVWESGGFPERLAAYMAARNQTPGSPDSTPSPDTESASETPSPASTRRTTSPRTTRPRKPKANRSPGPS